MHSQTPNLPQSLSPLPHPVFVLIGLGSNLGDREAHLIEALEELRKLCAEPDSWKVSQLYETEPIDCAPETARFLNAAVGFLTTCAPLELLNRCREIEVSHGRPSIRSKNASRTLDLDLLCYDQMTFFSPQLKIPHPQITQRFFVMTCLKDISPQFVIPGHSQTIQQIYQTFFQKT